MIDAKGIVNVLGMGNVHETARILGIPVTTLHSWIRRGRVPGWRNDHIERICELHGVKATCIEDL